MSWDEVVDSIPAKLAFEMLCKALERISDELFCASWIEHIEYEAWSWTQKRETQACPLPSYDVEMLAALGHRAGGWALRGNDGLTFLPMKKWLELYQDWDSRNPTQGSVGHISSLVDPITPNQATTLLNLQIPRVAECILLRYLHASQYGTPKAAEILGVALQGLGHGYEAAFGEQAHSDIQKEREIITPLAYESMEKLFSDTDDRLER